MERITKHRSVAQDSISTAMWSIEQTAARVKGRSWTVVRGEFQAASHAICLLCEYGYHDDTDGMQSTAGPAGAPPIVTHT
uniref:Uncharacterized protein n=1 Tax=Peronospora matthiolae TaxID=2874970 RepID=A0AAV1UM93_9STRA